MLVPVFVINSENVALFVSTKVDKLEIDAFESPINDKFVVAED
jgi:hypothetical protein